MFLEIDAPLLRSFLYIDSVFPSPSVEFEKDMLGVSPCESAAVFTVAAWSVLFAGFVRYQGSRCCDKTNPRPSIIATCDVIKVTLGTLLAFGVLTCAEAIQWSGSLWLYLIKLVLIVGAGAPISILIWHFIVKKVRTGIADGKFRRATILRALQASGRYNPRQRMGLEDEDCLDYRVDDDVVADGSAGDAVAQSSIPLLSWWSLQCFVWITIQGLVSAAILGIYIFLRDVMTKYDGIRLLGEELEKLVPLGCGKSAVHWLIFLGCNMGTALLIVVLSDRSHRYHGRTAHRRLTSPVGGTINGEESDPYF